MLFTVNNPKYTTRKETKNIFKNYLLKKDISSYKIKNKCLSIVVFVYPDFEIKVEGEIDVSKLLN